MYTYGMSSEEVAIRERIAKLESENGDKTKLKELEQRLQELIEERQFNP